MAWQKKLSQPKLQAREGKEYWQRSWRQKVCFQSLGPVTKPVQGAAPFFFNSKWLWNRKESKGMWFSVSGTEHTYAVKERMVGPALWRQRYQGMLRVSTEEHGMCWNSAHVLYQSRVQKTNPNFWKALSPWDIAALTAPSRELVLKQVFNFFFDAGIHAGSQAQCGHSLPVPGLCLLAGKHWLSVPQQVVPWYHLCMGVHWIVIIKDKEQNIMPRCFWLQDSTYTRLSCQLKASLCF